jgi:DNA polymerase-3 subunit delta'
MLIGHEKLRLFFEQSVANGTLSHAYCFTGPGSVGKRTFARDLAAELLKVKISELENHPDFIYLERTEDAKTGKLKKDIIIGQARALRERLGRTAWRGGYQVVIINEAELLNTESANALLKLLEEPPKQLVFFLITENEAFLLPTIRSRMQMFYFSLVPTKMIANGLVVTGVEKTQAEMVARLSLGRVGRAKELLQPEVLSKYEIERLRCDEIMAVPLYKRLTIVETLVNDLEEGERGREQLQTILEQWSLTVRDRILQQIGVNNYTSVDESSRTTALPKVLQEQLDRITRLQSLLHQNINTRLALEELCLHF